MKTTIVIPARYDSSRFPGKPLAIINRKTVLQRAFRIACAVGNADVYIATDDERIRSHAAGIGAKVIMTGTRCRNGSERVLEALGGFETKPDFVVNLQADSILTPGSVISSLIGLMQHDDTVQLATPAIEIPLSTVEKHPGVHRTFVVFDAKHNALYFSRAAIPADLTGHQLRRRLYQHIGIYAYRYDTLVKYSQLPPGELEQAEGLEQLRALEYGIPIRVVLADYGNRSECAVDCPQDIARIEKILEAEGDPCE